MCTMLEEALNEEDFGAQALRRTLSDIERSLNLDDDNIPSISFDASPWGDGGVLWHSGVAKQYTYFG